MIRRMTPAAGPSAWAIKTTAQRAADWESSLGRNLFQPAGGQSYWLSDEGQLRFLEFVRTGNGWFDVANAASTWVSRYGYWAQGGRGGLAIEFHDGAICWYPLLADYAWFGAMQGASSKGKFIHAYIYKKVGYQLVSN